MYLDYLPVAAISSFFLCLILIFLDISKNIFKKGVLKSKTHDKSFQKDTTSMFYFLSLESETNLSALLIKPYLSLKSPNIFSGETDSNSPFLSSGSE